jgi:hypothetical protein
MSGEESHKWKEGMRRFWMIEAALLVLASCACWSAEPQTAAIGELETIGPKSWPSWRGDGSSLSTDTGLELV